MKTFNRELLLPTESRRNSIFKNTKRVNWFESRRYKSKSRNLFAQIISINMEDKGRFYEDRPKIFKLKKQIKLKHLFGLPISQ